jgi:excisionase family DNA binding protein
MMEEKILQEIEELKSLTLLAAKSVLTIDDVALLTGISKSTLYKMTCKKQLPHYKPNSKLLFFDRKEIEEWAKQNRVLTTEEAAQKALAYSLGVKGGTR